MLVCPHVQLFQYASAHHYFAVSKIASIWTTLHHTSIINFPCWPKTWRIQGSNTIIMIHLWPLQSCS